MSSKPKSVIPRNVLFIGNSFTARNNLTELIGQFAQSRGRTLISRSITAGGASLRTHWNAGEAVKAIQTGEYDSVVLQEQSTLPIKNAVRMNENVRLFDEVIRASGLKTFLYMTWARQQSPETQTAITDAYVHIGQERGATVVPVGSAWQRFLATHEQPILHDKDGSHPSAAGTYLAACVFYATFFAESPVGIEVDTPGIDHKDRSLLQTTAWQTCKDGTKAKRSTRRPAIDQ